PRRAMPSALLLATIVVAPLATLWLFLRQPLGSRSRGAWPWFRRLASALFGTIVLGALTAGLLDVVGSTRRSLVAAVAGIVLMSLVWMPITRSWGAAAHLCWSMTILLFLSYLVFMLQWTIASHLGAAGTAGGLLLWFLELGAAILGAAYLW